MLRARARAKKAGSAMMLKIFQKFSELTVITENLLLAELSRFTSSSFSLACTL
jgi:hypothetical protein